jgi:hypothetical protein
VQKTER